MSISSASSSSSSTSKLNPSGSLPSSTPANINSYLANGEPNPTHELWCQILTVMSSLGQSLQRSALHMEQLAYFVSIYSPVLVGIFDSILQQPQASPPQTQTQTRSQTKSQSQQTQSTTESQNPSSRPNSPSLKPSSSSSSPASSAPSSPTLAPMKTGADSASHSEQESPDYFDQPLLSLTARGLTEMQLTSSLLYRMAVWAQTMIPANSSSIFRPSVISAHKISEDLLFVLWKFTSATLRIIQRFSDILLRQRRLSQVLQPKSLKEKDSALLEKQGKPKVHFEFDRKPGPKSQDANPTPFIKACRNTMLQILITSLASYCCISKATEKLHIGSPFNLFEDPDISAFLPYTRASLNEPPTLGNLLKCLSLFGEVLDEQKKIQPTRTPEVSMVILGIENCLIIILAHITCCVTHKIAPMEIDAVIQQLEWLWESDQALANYSGKDFISRIQVYLASIDSKKKRNFGSF